MIVFRTFKQFHLIKPLAYIEQLGVRKRQFLTIIRERRITAEAGNNITRRFPAI